MKTMYFFMVLGLSLYPVVGHAGSETQETAKHFSALQNLDHPTALTDDELSRVEGMGAILVGNNPASGGLVVFTPGIEDVFLFGPGDYMMIGRNFNSKSPLPFHLIGTPSGQFFEVGPRPR